MLEVERRKINMILKIVWKEGKSTLIDDIHNIDFERYLRIDYPEIQSEGDESSKYVYEITMHMKDGTKIKKNISSRFYIMNDSGKTVEIIKP
jgi:hypothetical protein